MLPFLVAFLRGYEQPPRGDKTARWRFSPRFVGLRGAVAGLTSIVGLIVNYVKRDRYDEFFYSHHARMIRSFWWAILWCIVGIVTIVLVIGWAILFVVWVWYIYRHVRGLIALINGEPMPA